MENKFLIFWIIVPFVIGILSVTMMFYNRERNSHDFSFWLVCYTFSVVSLTVWALVWFGT